MKTKINKTDELELIQKLKDGDRKTWAEVCRYYKERILYLINYYVRDNESKKEILQVVYAKMWTSIGKYDPDKCPLDFWIRRITFSKVIEHLRKKKERGKYEQPFSFDEDYSIYTDEEAMVDSLAHVRELINLLKPDLRKIVELIYFMGHTQPQAAVLLNLPLSTVKSRMQMAHAQLRKILHVNPKS